MVCKERQRDGRRDGRADAGAAQEIDRPPGRPRLGEGWRGEVIGQLGLRDTSARLGK